MKPPIRAAAAALLRDGLTVSVCESCTAGMLGALLTTLPGSSRFFKGGIIAYADEVKRQQVGVEGKVLARYGAVSRQTATSMAGNIRRKFHTDIGLAVTGIAGPSGATAGKPVGLVYIALSRSDRTITKRYRFYGSRALIRHQACAAAIEMLARRIA